MWRDLSQLFGMKIRLIFLLAIWRTMQVYLLINEVSVVAFPQKKGTEFIWLHLQSAFSATIFKCFLSNLLVSILTPTVAILAKEVIYHLGLFRTH
jgi:hypothetical protein